MNNFKEYLEMNAYSERTIDSYDGIITKFLSWCNKKGYDACIMDYKQCLEYVTYIQHRKNKITQKSINHRVGIIKLYFKYLIFDRQRETNPLENTNIKGVKRHYEHDLLSKVELEELYFSYQTENIKSPKCPSVAIRNKVMTGLAVFQGLDARSIRLLKMDNINLNKGKVYVPGSRRSNARTLDLNSSQIMPLIHYKEVDRIILQEKIKSHEESLFPMNSDRISSIVNPVFKELKKMNFRVTNIKQIRASVITNWLKEHDLRRVQYMAGHKYISSTEYYLRNDNTAMHEAIEKFHPMS